MTRLRGAWNILRGRPTAYRIKIENGGLVLRRGSFAAENLIIGGGVGIKVEEGA